MLEYFLFESANELSDDRDPNSGPHLRAKWDPALANWEPEFASSHRALG
ncbi:MAG: hypothetical protein JOY71_00490 [Acetobacteraceae bacterium]|nr:hypothetical protein [Acetobacteraceae bacterium]